MKHANFILLFLAIAITGCGGDTKKETPNGSSTGSNSNGKKIKIAYVTNGIAEFWNIAKAGAMKAAEELDCEVNVAVDLVVYVLSQNEAEVDRSAQ